LLLLRHSVKRQAASVKLYDLDIICLEQVCGDELAVTNQVSNTKNLTYGSDCSGIDSPRWALDCILGRLYTLMKADGF
jgi:hypothetical protein